MADLYLEIQLAQTGDETAMLSLIHLFQPLLRKYSYLLKYDDAYSDLEYAFMDLILKKMQLHKIENERSHIVSYINKTIYHCYILLSKRQKKCNCAIPFSSLNHESQDKENDIRFEDKLACEDDYSLMSFKSQLSGLTTRQAEIITLLYVYGYDELSVARKYSISVAAVSKTKKTALAKLREREE